MCIRDSSFTANPLGCAAANASLDLLEKEPQKYLSFEEKHLSHLIKFKNIPFIKKVISIILGKK